MNLDVSRETGTITPHFRDMEGEENSLEEIEFPTRYDASSTEEKWYAAWEQAGLFAPNANSDQPVFSITIPPPNITGALHMGHALCYPLQDMLGRYQRLQGKNVLILPGQDHAGIATQSVVEKQLRKEGLSGSKIGREKFVERVWEWRKESGDTILYQLRRLGCAFDWSRLRFTLDEDYARVVQQVFIEWFDRGLIFRGKRVVNWDPVLETSVSDIETERRLTKGKLYYIRYPYADGSGEVIIATTRPETMLADVAVAVHPSDKRYQGMTGKMLKLPLMDREIPLIADIYPDPAFGSGAVKITPAHDPNDYEVGIRHGLEMPVVLDTKGRVNELGGKYAGLDRGEARKQVVTDLEEQGFLVKVDDHEIPLIVSERSGEPIEPLLSEEWFCRQSELAKPVLEAVKRGEVSFSPDRYQRIFIEWMENIRDWNVSRKLWWGHRIPVYYTEDGSAVAAMSSEEAEAKAGKPIVRQDEDVLDTWFSSGLWPFATLGWPEKTADFKTFYPTSVLVTDRNIINLWVSRMLMMGYDLTGERPFSDVMIYATVLREDGRRMSKSLGTGVDPMTIIDSLGADALRYTLLSQTGENQDLRYSERRTEEARNFCNKIWNACRFVVMNVEQEVDLNRTPDLAKVDRWLLFKLAETEREARAGYDGYDVQRSCQALYRFFWNDLCDWYIEISKSRLSDPNDRQTPQWVLLKAFDAFLKMIHPVMPHISEELYQRLPVAGKSAFLMSGSWPTIDAAGYESAAGDIERAFEITRSLRALRASLDLVPLKSIPVAYVEGDLGDEASIIASQAWIEALRPGKPSEKALSMRSQGLELHMPMTGLVDLPKLLAALDKEEASLKADVAKMSTKLANPQFLDRANPEVVARDRDLLAELERRLEALHQRRELLQS